MNFVIEWQRCSFRQEHRADRPLLEDLGRPVPCRDASCLGGGFIITGPGLDSEASVFGSDWQLYVEVEPPRVKWGGSVGRGRDCSERSVVQFL